MKKITLLFTCLLMLCGCNKSNKDNIDDKKYSKVIPYVGVYYYFDDNLRCCVEYENYDEKTQKPIHKEWKVYLTNFYYLEYRLTTFYECYVKNSKSNKIEYCLIVGV